MTAEISDPAPLDLARYIRPGAPVAWGQGCAEPLTLTEALAAQRQQLGGPLLLRDLDHGRGAPGALRLPVVQLLQPARPAWPGLTRA
jgi:hypothetical protein